MWIGSPLSSDEKARGLLDEKGGGGAFKSNNSQ